MMIRTSVVPNCRSMTAPSPTVRPEAQIALDERRQRLERRLGVDLLARQAIHADMQPVVRAAPPLGRRQRIVMQEAQRHGVLVGIGAGEAGAADHHVDLVLAHVGPQAVPQQLDGPLVAIRLEHAGAAELHEAMVAAWRRSAARCRIRSACRSRACARRRPGAARGRSRPPCCGADRPTLRSPAPRLVDDEQMVANRRRRDPRSRRRSSARSVGMADISS